MSSDARALAAYLREARVQIEQVRDYLEGYDFDRFAADQRTVDAVAYRLLNLGEVIRDIQTGQPGRLEAEVSAEIPWRSIRGMRNRLAHDYENILPERIWDVHTDHLDGLLQSIDAFLAREP